MDMEEQLNSVLRLPLKELILRRLVIMSFNQVLQKSKVTYSRLNFMDRRDSILALHELKSLTEKSLALVKDKLSQLSLPTSLFKKATSIIEPIGSEIKNWMELHGDILFPIECKMFNETIFDKISWTPLGTIDHGKTAEKFILSGRLDCFVLDKFACMYCLEDYIPPLLGTLPYLAKCFAGKTNLQAAPAHLNNFWRHDIMDYNVIGREFRNSTFAISALMGNTTAAAYFYQKLTDEEREDLLLKIAVEVAMRKNSLLQTRPDPLGLSTRRNKLREELLSDVLCFLLSKMIPEQRIELLKIHSHQVLRSFLQWPWQDLFLDIAELALDFLSADHYCDLLSYLSSRRVGESENPDVDLFREFFRRSPSNLKNSYVDKECQKGCILFRYFVVGDSESIKCIFRNINAASKLRLAFCEEGFKVWRRLVNEDKLDLLKLFIREAMLSKEDMLKLKDSMPRFSNVYEYQTYRSKIIEWERFFLMCDESDGNASSKRSFAEDERVAKFRKT